MKETIKALHIAAQYLAAAAISFIPPKSDDSHTNLGWDANENKLRTHVFGRNKNHVALNLQTGNIEWYEGKRITQVLDIEDSTHINNIEWFKAQGVKHELKQVYQYKFHYELPYQKLKDQAIFIFKGTIVQEFAERLSVAQAALTNFVNENNLNASIRVWPHHFDMGIYAEIDQKKAVFFGAGLAIPDTVVDDLYFYAAGYKNGETISTKSFTPLTHGKWPTNWHGAVLASSQVDVIRATKFFKETADAFLSAYKTKV